MSVYDRITAVPVKIRELSITNPFVYAAIHRYLHEPSMTVEELLTTLVLVLAEGNDRYKQQLIDRMAHERPVYIIPR